MAEFSGSAITSNFGIRQLQVIPLAFRETIIDAAKLVERELKMRSPHLTGTMINRCKRYDLIFSPTIARIKIGWQRSDFSAVGLYFYPPVVDLGSGIRGGGSYIYPRYKSFLRFYSYKNDQWISIARSKGQMPQKIVNKTITNTTPKIMSMCRENIGLKMTRVGKV